MKNKNHILYFTPSYTPNCMRVGVLNRKGKNLHRGSPLLFLIIHEFLFSLKYLKDEPLDTCNSKINCLVNNIQYKYFLPRTSFKTGTIFPVFVEKSEYIPYAGKIKSIYSSSSENMLSIWSQSGRVCFFSVTSNCKPTASNICSKI